MIMSGWRIFETITSAYYGKIMYEDAGHGIVYSRYSHRYITFDDALVEFISLINGEEGDSNG